MADIERCYELTPATISRQLEEQSASIDSLTAAVAVIDAKATRIDESATRAWVGHEERIVATEKTLDTINLKLRDVATRGDIAELRLDIMRGRHSSVEEDLGIHKTVGELRDRIASIEWRKVDGNVKHGALGGGAIVIITMLIALIAGLLGVELPL
jgi:hypothetical protein